MSRSRLIQLFRFDEINPDTVLDELNRLKIDREGDKEKMQNIISMNLN